MYESIKSKLTEMLKAKNPEMEMAIEEMTVSFLPPDGMKGYVEYKAGDKMLKSMFDVKDNEIEILPDAEDLAINTESTQEEANKTEIVNKEPASSSSAMEEEEVTKGEDPNPEADNAKTENVVAEPTKETPEVKATPEAETTEPKTDEDVDNSKTSTEDTFEVLVDQYGYMTALKIKDGTITI